MNVYTMAWRSVWRNRRRSVVNIAAMTLSLCVLILYSGMVEGYVRGLEEDLVQVELGDLQIFAGDYLDNPSIHTRIEPSEPLVAELERAGFAASPRLVAGGLLARGNASAGVRLVGLEVQRDRSVSAVYQRIARGEWLDPQDLRGVVLGRGLARVLEARVGDELVVVSQAADGSIANDLLRVRGILGIVGAGTDRTAVFMNAMAFRELMVVPRGAHQVVVRRPPGSDLQAAARTVRRIARDYEVRTWQELMPTVAMMVEQSRSMTYLVFGLVYVAVGFLLLNAMLMAVFERIREFGVLKAVGMGPGRVLAMIMTEAAIQVGVALVVGLTASLPAMWYLATRGVDVGVLGGASVLGVAMRQVWNGVFTPASISGPVVTLLVVVFLAVLYPALRAAWIRPVAAMSHQ